MIVGQQPARSLESVATAVDHLQDGTVGCSPTSHVPRGTLDSVLGLTRPRSAARRRRSPDHPPAQTDRNPRAADTRPRCSTWNMPLTPRHPTSTPNPNTTLTLAVTTSPNNTSRTPHAADTPPMTFHVDHATDSVVITRPVSDRTPNPTAGPGRHNIPEQHQSNTSCCRHPAHDVPRGTCYGLSGNHTSSVGPNPNPIAIVRELLRSTPRAGVARSN